MTDDPTSSAAASEASDPKAVPKQQPFSSGLPDGALGAGLLLGIPGAPIAFQQSVQLWQGQFPPPDAISSYEATLPGSFDRIIAMAERAQQAQIETSHFAQRTLGLDIKRGQYLGFVITIMAIGGAVYCASQNQIVIAGFLLGVPLMTVAKALVDSAKAPKLNVPNAAPAAPTPPSQTNNL